MSERTDRELLELAAKAARIKVLQQGGSGYWTIEVHERGLKGWNPLIDDGDALRLAVKLRMMVDPTENSVSAIPADQSSDDCIICKEKYSDDPERATRRAVVRAAAAIGEQMP